MHWSGIGGAQYIIVPAPVGATYCELNCGRLDRHLCFGDMEQFGSCVRLIIKSGLLDNVLNFCLMDFFFGVP